MIYFRTIVVVHLQAISTLAHLLLLSFSPDRKTKCIGAYYSIIRINLCTGIPISKTPAQLGSNYYERCIYFPTYLTCLKLPSCALKIIWG